MLFLVYLLWDSRYNISVGWFLAAVIFSGTWGLISGLALLIPAEGTSAFLLYTARVVGILAGVSFFLFVLEFTTGKALSWKVVSPFLAVPLITFVVILADPSAFMSVQFEGRGYSLELHEFGMALLTYGLILHIMAISLLFRGYLTTDGAQQNQVGIIIIWYLISVVTVFAPFVLPIPDYFTVGVFGLLFLFIGTAYALQKFNLFTISPISKKEIFDKVSDGVVVLTPQNIVIEANQRAEELLDLDGGFAGKSVDEMFDSDAAIHKLLSDDITGATTFNVDREDSTKYLTVTSTDFHYGRGNTGTILVIQDVTPIKTREQQLDTLYQVFSRVFRHNIRNELTVIRGVLEFAQSENKKEHVDAQLESAIESTDKLLEHSRKAGQAEELIRDQHEPRKQPLDDLVETIVTKCKETYPDATIKTSVNGDDVLAVPGFGRAIECAIENAIVHNPYPGAIKVSSSTNGDFVTVSIEDNGQGIPDDEIEVLQNEKENSLTHGSGVGLWLIKWYTEKSGGEFDITSTNCGTTVSMTIPKA
ncbi:hypothetical protein K0C01_09545 [Salinarchaeum sp. IM2453]|uniref:ATP-binding protein n=1 Tax=Salinarchaeum sp. IM2453 TaxID=2862870 RepID=UPI001C82CE76|nr:ATP-binding protein [Salinarchaeum sp. IM2453]QZA88034.1 hypothetical protein K0C01_09545 [Salinarchaeum sp. IM2453]